MQPCWCVKTRTAGASPPQVLTRRGSSAGADWAGEVNLYVKDPLCSYATPLGLPPLAPAARCNLLVVILACTLMNSGSEGMAIGGGSATLCNRGSSSQASKTKFIGSKLEARFFLLCFFFYRVCVSVCGKLCLNCEGAVLSKLWNCGVTIFTFFMILFFCAVMVKLWHRRTLPRAFKFARWQILDDRTIASMSCWVVLLFLFVNQPRSISAQAWTWCPNGRGRAVASRFWSRFPC